MNTTTFDCDRCGQLTINEAIDFQWPCPLCGCEDFGIGGQFWFFAWHQDVANED